MIMELNNQFITKWIEEYMACPQNNSMNLLPGAAFDTPLVGFSRGDDPLYAFYKEHIDPN